MGKRGGSPKPMDMALLALLNIFLSLLRYLVWFDRKKLGAIYQRFYRICNDLMSLFKIDRCLKAKKRKHITKPIKGFNIKMSIFCDSMTFIQSF